MVTLTNALLVAAGGCAGAIARYAISLWAKRRLSPLLPFGTLLVNLTGSFLLGLLVGGDWSSSTTLLIGTGFMGAYTTFSTFKWETLQFFDARDMSRTIVYLSVSYAAGIGLAYTGYVLGRAVAG